MIFLITKLPGTAVLKPVPQGQFLLKPTSNIHIQNRSQNPETITMVVTTSSHENFTVGVLREPLVPTTPMAIVTEGPSSSPMVYHRGLDEPQYYGYVLIPVILMVVLAVISGVIFYWLQRRKRLDTLRHRLIPVYNFAPGEEEEWGVLLDMTDATDRPHLRGSSS